MAQSVLEAFRRFDKDNSGGISRDELAEVLGALGPEWDADAVDKLLAAADASGDGELQVEEFVRWVFAEDTSLSRGVQGLIEVAGCSREELNGRYVQQRKAYCRRPIFACAENGKLLFYHGERKQWLIHTRTGKYASARLKTHRAPHMCGEATWAVWKTRKNGKKAFLKETEMSCTVVSQKSPEELRAEAPKAVLLDGKLFKDFNYDLCDRPCYHHLSQLWIFYEGPKRYWKVGESCVLGRDSLRTSAPSEAYAPNKAHWMDAGGRIEVMEVDEDGIPTGWHMGVKMKKDIEEGWSDPSFPHSNESIGEAAEGKYKENRWLRALALHPNPSLFADLEPADACQGIVGNCWLIAAMSALAEFPDYIKSNIFVTKKVSKDGKYQLKLFDGLSNQWKLIEIDDYLPCTSWGGDEPKLLFGSIPEGTLCLALLEKAFAKLYGSYSKLSAGMPEIAWFHLSGCQEVFSYGTSYLGYEPKWRVTGKEGIQVVQGYWGYEESRTKLGVLAEDATFQEKKRIGRWIEFQKLSGTGPEKGWLKYYGAGQRLATRTAENDVCIMQTNRRIVPEKAMDAIGEAADVDSAFQSGSPAFVEPDEFWERLVRYDAGNYLMATAASTSRIERLSGLVDGHAYSLLHVREVQGLKMVCCRNPWGSEDEWNGPWSDRSEEWKANPAVREALKVDLMGFDSEGTFWMDYEDWLYVMGQLKVMNCRMPTARGGFPTGVVEVDEEDTDELKSEDTGVDGAVAACSGLFVSWHPPKTMFEEEKVYPDKDYTFQNVPLMLLGGNYTGTDGFPAPGTWTIEYKAPAKLYIWAAQGQYNAGVDEVLAADGWKAEEVGNFKAGALSLNVWSKHFLKGSSYSVEVTGNSMVGGVVATAPIVVLGDK